ncbi:mitochondrial K+-H+ exchange-related-domain-containing protein, partial [Coemansia spiralis]
MRVFVIPVTRTQWALHCQPINAVPTRLTKWATVASEKWSKWGAYPRTTWRGKIYTYGETLMDRISFKEYFLKEIPTKSEGTMVNKVDIIVPDILSEAEVLNDLRSLAVTQEPYHKRWMLYCCYLLPVSSLFTLVPLIPNFPFFYNLFRVYSHYKARHGALHLQHLLDRGTYEIVFDSELS